jgi:hypothetical protein
MLAEAGMQKINFSGGEPFLHQVISGDSIIRQGCQIFLDTIYQKGGKYTKVPLNVQMVVKCTKWQYYIPNDHKIYQHFPFQGPPKCTQIGIFGLKINHLATLVFGIILGAKILPRLAN